MHACRTLTSKQVNNDDYMTDERLHRSDGLATSGRIPGALLAGRTVNNETLRQLPAYMESVILVEEFGLSRAKEVHFDSLLWFMSDQNQVTYICSLLRLITSLSACFQKL